MRLVVDYRRLNAACRKEATALPLIEGVFDAMRSAKHFAKFDLRSGFWHVPMDPESVPLTAFASQLGVYEWLVMPFGLANAPKVFQDAMMEHLRERLYDGCVVFIDDVTLYSDTASGLAELMRWFFQTLKAKGWVVNPRKCELGVPMVKLLGHWVGQGRI